MININKILALCSRIFRSELYFISLVLLFVLLGQGKSQAQIKVSPLVIEAEVNRHQTQGVMNIQNNSQKPVRVRFYAAPFTYNRDSGFEILPSIPNDLAPYLRFSPREVNIPPGGMRRVRLVVRLAPNLPEGEYRTMIFSEPLEPMTVEKNQNNGDSTTTTITQITTRIGSAFYVKKGNIIPNLNVDSVNWNGKNNKLELLIRNAGKASIQTNITWSLKQGKTAIAQGEAPATTILAENERNILIPILNQNQTSLPSGNYQLVGKLSWGADMKNILPFNFNLLIKN